MQWLRRWYWDYGFTIAWSLVIIAGGVLIGYVGLLLEGWMCELG